MVNYKIRRAVEEDNDDLVPLIDLYSKRLVELYGNYYIAEILTRHKDSGMGLTINYYNGEAIILCLCNFVAAAPPPRRRVVVSVSTKISCANITRSIWSQSRPRFLR